MQKAYRPGGLAIGILDLSAAQQRAHDAQILAKVTNFHGLHTHDAHGGMAGADTEEHPARCELIDGRNRMGRDRGNTGAGNRHAGADLNA